MRDLKLLSEIQQYGSSASAMIQYAGMAVASGMASVVACVFADAPLQEGVGAGASYAARRTAAKGVGGIAAAAGYGGANPRYAMAARRHMETYGTTTEQFGAVAVAQRQWATMNPHAQLREPITLEDHRNSRWIAEPLRLFDCCLVSNGGVAVIVTTPERAADLAQPPVHVLGWGQAHPGTTQEQGSMFGLQSGAVAVVEDGVRHGRHRRGRCRRARTVRLLHLHGDRVAGGLRLLRQGRRRPAGRLGRARPRADGCRPTPAAVSSPRTTCGV